MNYSKIYNDIIGRAKTRTLSGYKELHHILPRCLGGDNSKSNLVYLTAEEHYLAHQLLVKMHPGNNSLIFAAKMMTISNQHHDRSKNKLYGWLRKSFAEAQSRQNTGKTMTEETCRKISASKMGNQNHKGKKHSEETKKRLSEVKKGRVRSQTEIENFEKAMLARKGKPVLQATCPVCNLTCAKAQIVQWHTNCSRGT